MQNVSQIIINFITQRSVSERLHETDYVITRQYFQAVVEILSMSKDVYLADPVGEPVRDDLGDGNLAFHDVLRGGPRGRYKGGKVRKNMLASTTTAIFPRDLGGGAAGRPESERLVDHLQLQGYVGMLGLAPNPYALMRRSGVFASASTWEGLPTVLMEAMACGVPVVATGCRGGLHKILEDGRYGWLVLFRDAEALSKAILQTLDNLAPASKLGRRSDDFALPRSVDGYMETLFEH